MRDLLGWMAGWGEGWTAAWGLDGWSAAAGAAKLPSWEARAFFGERSAGGARPCCSEVALCLLLSS